jgi:Predicted membrane protein (DUF2232)
MMKQIATAIGAGLTAALLFAAGATSSTLTMLLACLSPLPIVIATLGWGWATGALAAATASAICFGLIEPFLFAAGFCLTFALPGWLLGVAAALPRERFPGRANRRETGPFPLSVVVSLAALFGALSGFMILASFIHAFGSYEAALAAGAAGVAPSVAKMLDDIGASASAGDVSDIAMMSVRLLSPMWVATICFVLCANLYAGARVVQLSQRLTRPWPILPESLVLPPFLAIGLAMCAALGFVTTGWIGCAAWIGVGALGGAYVLEGLAAVHSRSRGWPMRATMLVALYLLLFALPLISTVVGLLGLADSLNSLRAKRAAVASAIL